MSKHAYLIMAHQGIEMLDRLLHAIDYPENEIFLHIDSKWKEYDTGHEFQLKYSPIVYVKRIDVSWGGYSQIQCEMNLIERAIASNDYQYLHILSGVDYPIKKQEYIHQMCDNNPGIEYVEYDPVYDSILPERYKYYHPFQEIARNKNNIFYRIDHILINIQKCIGYNRARKNIMVPHKGPNWVSITGEFARYIVGNKKEIRRTYKYSRCCDEVFLQTLLFNSSFANNAYEKGCMRQIDWKRGNPYIFNIDDFEELKNSNAWFARKLTYEKSSELINRINTELLGI